MEVTGGLPSIIRSGTGLAGPARGGAMAVPSAATALEDCLQAVGGVPWLFPGTQHPWSGSPSEANLMRRTPPRIGGEEPLPAG